MFCLSCMWHHFCVSPAGCAISLLETFWKSCLVPSLPSNGRDTNLTISNSAVFYSIKRFSSNWARQNDAASSLLSVSFRVWRSRWHSVQVLTLTCIYTKRQKSKSRGRKALHSASAHWFALFAWLRKGWTIPHILDRAETSTHRNNVSKYRYMMVPKPFPYHMHVLLRRRYTCIQACIHHESHHELHAHIHYSVKGSQSTVHSSQCPRTYMPQGALNGIIWHNIILHHNNTTLPFMYRFVIQHCPLDLQQLTDLFAAVRAYVQNFIHTWHAYMAYVHCLNYQNPHMLSYFTLFYSLS